jgi:hypothetical protein
MEMTYDQMVAQLAELAGEQIVYGCRPTSNPRDTGFYTGKLVKNEDESFSVHVSPLLTAIKAMSADKIESYPIPADGWYYSFVVSAADWNADRAAEAERKVRPPSAFGAQGPVRQQQPRENRQQRPPPANAGRGTGVQRDNSPQPRNPSSVEPTVRGGRGGHGGGAQKPKRDLIQEALAEAQREDDDQTADDGQAWSTLDEATAVDPESWPFVITSTADTVHLKMLLAAQFPPNPAPHATKDNATTEDCIKIAVAIARAMGIMTATGTADPTAIDSLVKAAQCALKRALIIRFLQQGHAAQYVQHFSNAVEGQTAPPWIRNAQALATQAVKAATAAPFQYKSRGGDGGARGRFRGNQGRGNGGARGGKHQE